jgi:predicted MFS family arabinose efflux permease
VRGLPAGDFFDIGIFYDEGARLLMPFGWIQGNVAARIEAADLAVAQQAARDIHGAQTLALGGVATVQGVGASLSGLAAGLCVDHFGYTVTFLMAAVAAAIALIVCLLLMK